MVCPEGTLNNAFYWCGWLVKVDPDMTSGRSLLVRSNGSREIHPTLVQMERNLRNAIGVNPDGPRVRR